MYQSCLKILKYWHGHREIFIFPLILRPSAALCENVDTPLKQYECCAGHYDMTRRCNIASAGQCFDNIFLFKTPINTQ